jgi:hypothetical protein
MVVKPITARGTRGKVDFWRLHQRKMRREMKRIRGRSKSQKKSTLEKKENIFLSNPLNWVLQSTEL